VKNNLASIVTLLSIERPDMSPEALAWLNRASERIATMARTHELFVGGRERVDLRDLVAKLLPALSLIKPAGADVRADLDGVDVELGTERAVGLAMVLNELCWNALEHGTSPNGVLLIRARGAEGRRLVLEIEDDGGGERPPTQAPGAAGNTNVDGNSLKACGTHGRGTGLRLVEGLVSRELRGTFVMNRTPAGGMIARVEIPLEHAEAVRLSL
jgi:two-component sensor histidine kinase